VAKVAPDGTTTVYVYDAFGKLAAEYSNPGPLEPATSYLTADHLGSTRLVTGSNGAVQERHDYLPFGEELFAGTGPRTQEMGYPISEPLGGVRQKFAGKERDAETGLDYFGARYYSGAQGRFNSPDEPLMDQHMLDPQSWNLYSYARNNPLRFFDPSGRTCVAVADANGNTTGYKDVEGPGGTCADALRGDKEESRHPSATVTAQGPPSPLLAVVAAGALRTGPVVNTLAELTMAFVMGPGWAALQTPEIMTLSMLGGRLMPGPPAGTGRPSVAPASPRPSGIPDDWIPQPSKKGGGTTYMDPANPYNRIRVMPGNPNSPNPAQRQPYVKWMRDGHYLDKNGNAVPGDSPEAHIPVNEFRSK
jgi:RHS repeat-associated protein